jgi:predicted transcriptional regulator of viral defense system
MEAISKLDAIKILHQKKVTFFDVVDARKIFGIEKNKTLYVLLQRLEKDGVVNRIVNGKYHFALKEYHEFELANFLINPSYISLESALSFYGILPQFPYTITSLTPLKTKKINYQDKEYEYSHLDTGYFWGFLKKDKFLIASPEKAFLDELYFMAKKLRNIHLQDLNLKAIDRKKICDLSKRYKFIPLHNLLANLKIC